MVSAADRDAEAAIERLLADERPDDGLLGEEGATSESVSGRRWVVDPLDGTTNYLYGLQAWCVSVALEDAEGGLVGVIHDAVRDETFKACRGGGSELNGGAIAVRDHDDLSTALIATGFGYETALRSAQADKLVNVLPEVRDIRRGGAAALDLAWLAAGRLDGYFERGLKQWDWGAGRLLIAEAGGRVRELRGEPSGLVAAGPRLIDALERLVA